MPSYIYPDRARFESETLDQSILGDSIKLPVSGLVAPSRFLKGAMTEQLASWDPNKLEDRGIPSEQLIKLYEEWGKGGFGIILTGNTMVNPVDLENPANPIVYRPFETPERIDAFRRQAEAARAHGSLVVMQLSHGGRQVAEFVNPHPISASDVQLETDFGKFGKPRAMTLEDIEEVIDQFAYGAEFAHKTGYDGVQLHCAHGYLLAQFLAETTNKRTDEYGGSLHNRARIIYRIVEEIKRRVPDPKFSLSVKINSAEFQKGGFQPEECRDVCRHLQELGLDWVELSGGTYEVLAFRHIRDSTRRREAFFLDFAGAIRPALKIPTFVTGGWVTAAAMISAIKDGSTDGIGLARPVCEEPHLPKQLIRGQVHSKVASKLAYDDFAPWLGFAGAQMRRVGSGMDTADSSNDKVVADFLEELQTFYSVKMKKLTTEGVIVTGHPRLGTSKLPWELE